MKPVLLALFIIPFLSIYSRAQSRPDASLDEAKKAISASNAKYFSLAAKNDGSIANLYADDAWLLPADGPSLHGHDAIVKFFSDAYKAGARNGTLNTLNIYGDGKEYVTEVGLVAVFNGEGQKTADDKYMIIWKKTGKGWKMFRDMFSSNLPK